MTGTGWEFYGVRFSMFVTMLVSLVMFLSVWFGAKKNENFYHVDAMAGDEGED
ncbi:MAG TPA: hypothetical protein VFF53_04800 [Geobacteraceae bacterium]|nr:hypothetical protein [Geobacteraceae bacterium]